MSKNSYQLELYAINICEDMIFKLYTALNKHGMIRIGNQTKEKTQI